jgi:hypothetical protein
MAAALPWLLPAAATVADLITRLPEAVTVVPDTLAPETAPEAETLAADTAPVTAALAAETAPVTVTLSNSGSAKATPTALVFGIVNTPV